MKASNAYTKIKNNSIQPEQFLTFGLSKDLYAVNIRYVKEIKNMFNSILPISNAPPYLIGVVHLYDSVLPVIDLRIYYKIEKDNANKDNIIIILNINNDYIGILVDGNFDIIELLPSEIKTVPHFLSLINPSYIQGIGLKDEKMFFLLDINRLLAEELKLNQPLKSGIL